MENVDKIKEPVTVKAVDRVVSIIETLAGRDNIGVSEIANVTGLSKATAYRFLQTLENLGYVRQDGDSLGYNLTLRLFELASLVRSRRTVFDEALPMIVQLSKETEETVHLATLESGRLVYLHKIDSQLALKVSMMSRIGQSAPVYCTGVGKALLAHLPETEVLEIIRNTELKRYTVNTITDLEQLKSELSRIREQGYAMDNEEHEMGVRCIAAPIKNYKNETISAVSVSVPSVRLTNDRFDFFKSHVLKTASIISSTIAGDPLQRRP